MCGRPQNQLPNANPPGTESDRLCRRGAQQVLSQACLGLAKARCDYDRQFRECQGLPDPKASPKRHPVLFYLGTEPLANMAVRPGG